MFCVAVAVKFDPPASQDGSSFSSFMQQGECNVRVKSKVALGTD